MGGSIQVPNNIEDKTILKRFLTDLVLGINSNTLFSGNVQEQNAALVNILVANPNIDFLNIVSKLTELRTEILSYVEDNLETVILQNTKDVAIIAEQFGTFYNQALATSWYGLSVKAGGAVAGLEVGSLDPDVNTPVDENSYFRVIADNFIVGRAYEDLSQEEKDYLATNNLPSFGTVYDANKKPVPALVTTWDGGSQIYRHYFNGIVQFSNISGADYANAINLGTTTINGGKITTSTLEANVLKPAVGGTTVWSGGALISQNFNGNAVGNIGNPTTGFRLSSNAVGNPTDPNIYGAYIKGGTLEGTNLITLTDAGYTTKFSYSYYASLTITSTTSFTLSFPIYGYNYSGNGYKVRSLNNNNYAILIGPTVDGYEYYATQLAAINAPLTSCTIQLVSGNTNLGSYTFPSNNASSQYYTINGTTFVYHGTSTSCYLGVLDGLLSVDNLTSSGELKLLVSFGAGTNTNATRVSFSHMNR